MMKNKRKTTTVLLVFIFLFTHFIVFHAPVVKSIQTHYYWGYIKYYNSTSGQNESVPNGITVTLTNQVNSNTTTALTEQGNGFYMSDVSEISGTENGDVINVNCTYQGQIGNKSEAVNVSLGSQNVSFNLSETTLSINITPNTWNASTISLGSYAKTTGNTFNLTNNGTETIDVLVHGENITWGTPTKEWTLNQTADTDKYTMQYQINGGSWTSISTSNSTFTSSLAPDNWKLFDLNITMPTTSTQSLPNWPDVDVWFWVISS